MGTNQNITLQKNCTFDKTMVKVAFLHPDPGIGGAERLVVDAAIALKNKGHEVSIITAHHDPNHCFEELVMEISLCVVLVIGFQEGYLASSMHSVQL